MPTEDFLFIRSELEAQSAQEAARTCAERVSTSGPLHIEFDQPRANIFALQLAIAAKRSLQDKGAFLGFGPIAMAELGSKLTDTAQGVA